MKYHDYTWLKGFTAAVVAICVTLLFLFGTTAQADVTDLRLEQGKVFDSQWNVSNCTAASGTCTVSGLIYNQLYSPGVGFVNFTAGMTVRFSYNNGSNATNPIQLELWNADGTLNRVMIPYGRFIAFENGANEGRQYMFVDNSTWYGYYINLQASTSTTSSTWNHGGAATMAQYQALNQSMVSAPPPPAMPTSTASPSSGSSLYPYTRGTSGRGWLIRWWDNAASGSWSQSNASYSQGGTGSGFYSWVTGYIRWPGAMDGVSRTLWFRTGWDDDHRLYINGQQVTNGVCCSYAYGSYTAKPGEILYIQFYTNNSGGGPWSFEIAWDPQQDGTYEVLGGESIGQEALGGSSWYSSTETVTQINQRSTDKAKQAAMTSGNRVYITQSGVGPTVDVIQESNYNYFQGPNAVDAPIIGNYNTVRVRQGDGLAGSSRNLIELSVNGDNNTLTLLQGWNGTWGNLSKDGIETGGHFLGLSVTGSNNSVTTQQINAGSATAGHYNKTDIVGSTNSVTVKQGFGFNAYHSFFGTITGNSNYVDVWQTGEGAKYMDLALTGSGHTVVGLQTGTGAHRATINLANDGGASTINLTQQGSVAQQYNITQACANLSGCSVTVTQGSP
jgi:hypothetical protein